MTDANDTVTVLFGSNFRLSNMAVLWLMKRGYNPEVADNIADGSCPRDFPDLIEAFRRHGIAPGSEIETATLTRGTLYYIETDHDGNETLVTEDDFRQAGAGEACGMKPVHDDAGSDDMSLVDDRVLKGMSLELKLDWLRYAHLEAYNAVVAAYSGEHLGRERDDAAFDEVYNTVRCVDGGPEYVDSLIEEILGRHACRTYRTA